MSFLHGMHLKQRLLGVCGIAVVVSMGLQVYPPVLALLIVCAIADEYYRICRQQFRILYTHAAEEEGSVSSLASLAGGSATAVVPAHVSLSHPWQRAAFVSACGGQTKGGQEEGEKIRGEGSEEEGRAEHSHQNVLSVSALVSHHFLTCTALLLSVLLLVLLLFHQVETAERGLAAASPTPVQSGSKEGEKDRAEQKEGTLQQPIPTLPSAVPPPSPPRNPLLLHPTSPLASVQEFYCVIVLLFGLWYAGWLFSHAVLILTERPAHAPPPVHLLEYLSRGVSSALGVRRLLYVIFVTAGGENGGLFLGKMFGRHKLAPRVSPNKTVEGAAGQLLVAAIVSPLFAHYVEVQIPTGDLVWLGLLIGFAGMLGDLFESFLKRSVGTKDCGNIIPGVGGVLDRMDGLVFTFPLFYYYRQYGGDVHTAT